MWFFDCNCFIGLPMNGGLKPPVEKVLFGTDAPVYSQHEATGQLLSADITDADIHNICHRNAEALLEL